MPSFKKTFAAVLRSYPLGNPEPVDAMVTLMMQRGGWDNGQIVLNGMDINAQMDYSDLAATEHDTFSQLMRKRSQTLHRKLIDSQMDGIVENPTDMYFRASYHRTRPWCEILEGSWCEILGGEYCRDMAFLDFPEDIKPDWGKAVLDFHSWVQQELRSYHLVQVARTEDDDGISHWPEGAKKLRDDIQAATERLYPLVHGISYQEHLEKSRELSDRLIKEMLAEEQQQSSSASKRFSP